MCLTPSCLFAIDGNSNGGSSGFRKKTLKNPEAETAFLPDPERDRQEKEMREKLKQEWLDDQERIKSKSTECAPVACSMVLICNFMDVGGNDR